MDPQIGPWGSKYAKIAQKLSFFQVLELWQVTGGSDKVAFVTKKFYLDKIKIVCDKNFLSRAIQGARGQKSPKKGHFRQLFIMLH